MNAYKEDILDVELESGNISRSFSNRTIGEGDIDGNKFGIRCWRKGEPVSLTGCSCIGYFIRGDGVTVVINGTVAGNMAYVTIPQEACAIQGQYKLTIKVAADGQSVTIRMIDGTVVETVTGSIVDPGGVIPDIEELMALVTRIEAATAIISQVSLSSELITGTRYRLIANKTT